MTWLKSFLLRSLEHDLVLWIKIQHWVHWIELYLADFPHVPQGHCGREGGGPGFDSIPALRRSEESSVAGMDCSPSEKVMHDEVK